MWRDILLANRQELLEQAEFFRRTLQAMEQLIDAGKGDVLEELIANASQLRANWRMGARKA
jgi:prephenate dehydrogenase